MNKDNKIYVAGHRGMVGSAIVRILDKQGHSNFIFRTHDELDLTNQLEVQKFIQGLNPIEPRFLLHKMEVVVELPSYLSPKKN